MRLRTKAPLWIGFTTIACLFVLKAFWHRAGPNVILNRTSSVPKGFYLVRPLTELERGTVVVFPIPREVLTQVSNRLWLKTDLPLIKPTAAIAGDIVCVSDGGVIVNNILMGKVYQNDFQGLPLPHIQGCFAVPEDYFFPLSLYSDHSFDGRYFGTVPIASVIGQAVPLLTW